jgi:hypothetical protein
MILYLILMMIHSRQRSIEQLDVGRHVVSLEILQQKLVFLLFFLVVLVKHVCSCLQQQSSIVESLINFQTFLKHNSKSINDFFFLELLFNACYAKVV